MTQESTSEPRKVEIPVRRDGPLPRFSADTAVCAFLGHDIELGLLLGTPLFKEQVVTTDSAGASSRAMRTSRELLEVARIRISPGGAQELAYGILARLLEQGIVEAEDLQSDMKGLIRDLPPNGNDTAED